MEERTKKYEGVRSTMKNKIPESDWPSVISAMTGMERHNGLFVKLMFI